MEYQAKHSTLNRTSQERGLQRSKARVESSVEYQAKHSNISLLNLLSVLRVLYGPAQPIHPSLRSLLPKLVHGAFTRVMFKNKLQASGEDQERVVFVAGLREAVFYRPRYFLVFLEIYELDRFYV